jgi:hypothetical protein
LVQPSGLKNQRSKELEADMIARFADASQSGKTGEIAGLARLLPS